MLFRSAALELWPAASPEEKALVRMLMVNEQRLLGRYNDAADTAREAIASASRESAQGQTQSLQGHARLLESAIRAGTPASSDAVRATAASARADLESFTLASIESRASLLGTLAELSLAQEDQAQAEPLLQVTQDLLALAVRAGALAPVAIDLRAERRRRDLEEPSEPSGDPRGIGERHAPVARVDRGRFRRAASTPPGRLQEGEERLPRARHVAGPQRAIDHEAQHRRLGDVGNARLGFPDRESGGEVSFEGQIGRAHV